jgi:hypothetical protein
VGVGVGGGAVGDGAGAGAACRWAARWLGRGLPAILDLDQGLRFALGASLVCGSCCSWRCGGGGSARAA